MIVGAENSAAEGLCERPCLGLDHELDTKHDRAAGR